MVFTQILLEMPNILLSLSKFKYITTLYKIWLLRIVPLQMLLIFSESPLLLLVLLIKHRLKKSLIEEPTVELLELFDKVSEEAAKEKLAVPPINKMVYYWTRKPLIVGRAVALASTLDNIEDVKSLLHLGRDKRAYTYTCYVV